MSDFPKLKTGAAVQYPLTRELSFSTEVMHFLDGSQQRFPNHGSPLRRWFIRLDQLDDAEVDAIERFFSQQQGPYGSFSFRCPIEQIDYPDCSVENPELALHWLAIHQGQLELVIRQNP